MSASAKDLPDADLENLIREKQRQALAEPGLGRPSRIAPEAAPPHFAASASMRLGAGPTLAIDPSDRVLPVTGSGRRGKSLVPIIVIVVAVAAVAAVVTWTQQGSGDFAIFASPTTEPGSLDPDRGATAENKPPVAPSTLPQPAATAQQAPVPQTPVQQTPVQQAAPVQPAPAAQPVAPVQQAAPAQPAAPVAPAAPTQQAEKKEAAPAPQKAPEEKTVKPAEKKQTAEKKVKPAEKPKQAAAKPKPAATDEGDASFSTLLNSLTNEASQQETAAPANTQPVVQQPPVQPSGTQPKSSTPLPTSTAPSTPGTQLFNP
jgi:hypothetical protein